MNDGLMLVTPRTREGDMGGKYAFFYDECFSVIVLV